MPCHRERHPRHASAAPGRDEEHRVAYGSFNGASQARPRPPPRAGVRRALAIYACGRRDPAQSHRVGAGPRGPGPRDPVTVTLQVSTVLQHHLESSTGKIKSRPVYFVVTLPRGAGGGPAGPADTLQHPASPAPRTLATQPVCSGPHGTGSLSKLTSGPAAAGAATPRCRPATPAPSELGESAVWPSCPRRLWGHHPGKRRTRRRGLLLTRQAGGGGTRPPEGR